MFAEDCPVEDRDILNDGTKCKEVTKDMCKRSTSVKTECCAICKSLIATPWLGPNCTNGDLIPGCESLNTRDQCVLHSSICCETCCPLLGADPGYSCTLAAASTSPSKHTTEKITTTSTTAKSTVAPTTLKSAPSLVSVLTTTKQSTADGTATTSAIMMSSKLPEEKMIRSPNHKLLFRILIQITKFEQAEFNCADPDLQDQESIKYLFFNVSCLTNLIVFFLIWQLNALTS